MTDRTTDTKPSRVTKSQMFMQMAHVVKSRSTCSRAQVGCVIMDIDGTSILSMGYNGNAKGLPNTCDSSEPGKCGCIHAEINALLKCPYHGVGNLALATTTSPCLSCAKLILNSKVTVVYVDVHYRSTEGVRLLINSGIRVYQQSPDQPWLCGIVFNQSGELITTRQPDRA